MMGFINPNSIKLNESSDHKEVIYSHLAQRCADAGITGYTFSLMKLEKWMICGIPSNRRNNTETDVLAALIHIMVHYQGELVCEEEFGLVCSQLC